MKSKKKSSVVEPKVGEQYITMNAGLSGEYNVKVLKRLPKNWSPIKGAMTAPRGYKWVSNNKSLFKGERKTALVKISDYHKQFPTEVEPIKILGKYAKVKTEQPPKRRKAVTQSDLNEGIQNFLKVKDMIKSGEARNLAFKKPMKFFREHTVEEAIKIINAETKKGQ